MFDWSDVTRRFKDLASLIETKPVFRWGIITNANPLLVQLDGDDRPLAGSPSTIIGGLTAGERVLCLVQNRRVTVLGRGGADNANYMHPAALGGMLTFDMPSGGGQRTLQVDFPTGYFTRPPIVMATLGTGGGPTVTINVNVSSVSTESAIIAVNRSNSTSTSVRWIAIPAGNG